MSKEIKTIYDLVEGEIYSYEVDIPSANYMIERFKELDGLEILFDLSIDIKRQEFKKYSQGDTVEILPKNIKLATKEEAQWLLLCEKEGKYVTNYQSHKWEKDSYVVLIDEYGGYRPGTVARITKCGGGGKYIEIDKPYYEDKGDNCIISVHSLMWFPTKETAEEYSLNTYETTGKPIPGLWHCYFSNHEEFEKVKSFYNKRWNRPSVIKGTGFTNNVRSNNWIQKNDNLSSVSVEISFDFFIKNIVKEKEIKIPEAWYIEVTEENRDILSTWRGSTINRVNGTLGYIDNTKWWTEGPPLTKKKINTEFFEEYILDKEKEYKYKYPKGPIEIHKRAGNGQVYNFYTDIIPNKYIKHGGILPKENIRIVDFYKEYYIVAYMDELEQEVQLAFKEESLYPVKAEVKKDEIDSFLEEVEELKERHEEILTEAITKKRRIKAKITNPRRRNIFGDEEIELNID